MLKRTVFGILAAIFGITIVVFCYTPAMVVTVAALSATACFELNKCIGLKNKPINYLSIVMAALIPVYYEYASEINELLNIKVSTVGILVFYIVILMALMIAKYEQTKFEEVASVIVTSIFVPYVFATLFSLRDMWITYPQFFDKSYGRFFILFALLAAWLTDTFAYFTGSLLGKHKMCPNISPKKTVEGAVGGVVGGVISCVILFAVYDNFFFEKHSMNYVEVVIIALLLALISMVGDLSASVIKRNFGVKDFGNVVPGHGGVMDRFDSGLFVIAALNAIIMIYRGILS
jgi:phosphatidate cytidylyltransferase